MKLKIKDLNLSSGGPLIAVMHEDDASKLDLHPSDRISISKDKKSIVALLNIASTKVIEPGIIGVYDEVIKKIGLKTNQIVDVSAENKPISIDLIKKKLNKHKLDSKEIDSIIKDAIENKLSQIELTYFISACYMRGLSINEIVGLINAIVNNGSKVEFNKKIVVDKHCIGGVPGNRTTMLVVPIIAAAGVTIPKASSRAITSAAGTADTMEVFCKVDLDSTKIKNIVEKTNGCIVWGGGAGLASGDDMIIKLERPLKLDPEGILLSSIMAKKKAVGATHVLIDIPYGIGAKIESKSKALKLRKLFIKVGKRLGIKVKVILTDGTKPIGRGIGPSLEARDVLYVLTNDSKAPLDLKEKAIKLSGILLEMVGKGDEDTARKILESGKAYEKFKEIIVAQGGKSEIKAEDIRLGKYSYIVKAKKRGIVSKIDNKALASICRVAGTPKDKEAGVYLNKNVGDKVEIGEILFSVYSDNGKKLQYSTEVFKSKKIIEVK